jgi:hypothetical protein
MNATATWSAWIARGRKLVIVGVAVILAFVIAACGDSFSDEAQQNDDGDVTVTVDWENPDDGFVFTIGMDTHSVDLDGYDLSELAILILDDQLEVYPDLWDAPRGGHHRSGSLQFSDTAADGTIVDLGRVRSVELVVQDVAGVPERSFKWTQ